MIAVTREGDVLGAHYASGGSSAQPSLIEVQAAIDDAETRLAEASHVCDRLRCAQSQLDEEHRAASQTVEITLARLHESDAAMAALAEALGRRFTARSSRGEVRTGSPRPSSRPSRPGTASPGARRPGAAAGDRQPVHRRGRARPGRTGAPRRAGAAGSPVGDGRATGPADGGGAGASPAGRADALRRAAENERQARARAVARRERMQREARAAAAVHRAGGYLAQLVEVALAAAATERAAAEAARMDADSGLGAVRATLRRLTQDFESLVDAAHRGERPGRAADAAGDSYREGDDRARSRRRRRWSPTTGRIGSSRCSPARTAARSPRTTNNRSRVAYVREQQQKRLRIAERSLGVLGRVNPLALEEFDAMEERHKFLSEQLDDLRRTRRDLLDIIDEVDNRVEQVFAEAFADVEAGVRAGVRAAVPGRRGPAGARPSRATG